MNQSDVQPRQVVLSYIEALDDQMYEEAMAFLQENVRIKGPAGETFGKPLDFVEMLRKYRGKYDVKKVFADGADVCVLYDLIIGGTPVYMSSLNQVWEVRIVSIDTVFDPSAMGPPPGKDSGRGAVR